MAVDVQASPPYAAILVPTDFSTRARDTYRAASALAREGSRLIALHVVESVPVAYEGHEQALDQRLRELVPPVPGVVMDYRLAEGDPAEQILRVAAEESCDLIVIASHGRTGLDRLLMGSVAEKVARGARCTVQIVRAPRS
jgi:nucleotide-binding universal stress UspA family protein